MKTTLFLFASVALTVSVIAADQSEQSISLKQAPAPAAQALQKLSGGAKIEKVSKESDQGKVIYEAKFTKSGRTQEVSVDADGKLVATEEAIDLSDAPKAVRSAIGTNAKDGKLEKVERVTENGKTTFEALISGKSKREEIVFDSHGKVVEREDKTHDKD